MPNDHMKHPGEEHSYGPGEKLPSKPRNGWKVVSQLLLITTIFFIITTLLAYYHIINPVPSSPTGAVSLPTIHGISTGSTPLSSGPTTQPAAPTAAPNSNDYSAPQPGPGCDNGGGTWTPQGVINITCGTQLHSASTNTWGYLYLQLPPGKTFASNNEISIKGGALFNNECLGLAEQDANTGFLAAYCGNGQWSIFLISNQGAVVKTLDSGTTSLRQSEQLSLTLSDTTLSFAIDAETYKTSISPLQPAKVAIGFYMTPGDGTSFSVQGFSYITSAS